MLEQPRQQQDELIPQLQKRIAALEQENTLLKQTLADLWELEQRYRLLENCDRILEATVSASNALLTIENFDEAVNTALQIIGEKLDSDRVAVIENLDSPPDELPRWKMLYEWHSSHTVPQISHPNVAQGSYEEIKEWYALFSQGEGVSCLFEEMPEPFRSGQAQLSVKAFHIVPIFVEGECWGVVGFDDCREAKRRSLDELAVLKTAAACIGSAIESDRTRQALLRTEQERSAELEHINAELRQALDRLAESEERFRTLFEYSSEGFNYVEFDPPYSVTLPIEEQCELYRRNLRVVKVNPAFAAMYGVENPDDLIGLKITDVHVEDSEKNTAFIRAIVENGYRGRNIETEEIDIHGQLRYFLNSGVITIKDGYVVNGWGTQVDITELRQTQQALLHAEQERAAELAKVNEELRQRDRLLSAVAQITKDLLETEDVALVIPAVLLAIGKAANMSRVQLILERQNPSTQKRQHFIAYEWVAEGITPQISHPDMAVMDNDDFEVIIQELYVGRSVWQVVDSLPEPAKVQFESIEIKSTGTIPIFIEGHYIGSLAFDDCITPRHWTQQEIDVLTAAAEIIGAALHRKQLIERLIEARTRATEERAAELESLNTALRRETRERCQAEEVIRSQNSALKHSLERLLQEPDIRGFLGALLDTLITQLQGHAANIWLLEDDRTTLTLWTAFGLGQLHINPEETLLPYDPIPVDLVVQTILSVKAGWQQTIQYSGDDPRLPLPLQEFHKRDRICSVLTTPLRLGHHLLGWLTFATQEDLQQIPSDKVAFLEAIAHQATLAIRLHHLAEEAKQAAIAREQEKAAQERAAELAKANHALRESLGSLASNPELDTFLGYMLLEMATQIDAVKNYLFLYDQATNTLALHTFVRDGKVFSKEANNFEPFAQPISADTIGVWGLMIQQKSPLNLALEQDNPSCWPGTYEWHRAQGHQEVLCVPLILGEEPLGFLGLAFTEKAMLSPQDIELAQALAHQVTLAMQLTRLAEESRQTAILEERNRMAQEIHDTLAQAFAGIGMQLQAATRFRTTNPEKAQTHCDRAYALAQTGLTEARRSVWALSQEGLEYSDLAASVTRIAEQLTAGTSLQADIEVQGTPYSVEPEVGLNLLRIVQEAIANALRHAQAQTIQIQITYEPTYVRLGVRDDGRGFNPHLPVKGFGLASMQQRADHVGAQLLVSSQLDAGTEIAVILPMGE